MELKPRTKTEELIINAYGNDAKKFKDLVTKLNEDLKRSQEADGEYTEEDVFSHILAVFFENKPEYQRLLKADGRTLRHRQSNQAQAPVGEASENVPRKAGGNKRKGANKADAAQDTEGDDTAAPSKEAANQ